MICLSKKEECCGCTACFNKCPQNAISMQYDEEGFKYPSIDKEKCIDCNLCEKVCPVIHKEKNTEKTEGYIIRNSNKQILFESTSGGAFTAIAEYVLNNGGIVYGAGYDQQMNVVCKEANDSLKLSEMRGSKFVQSDLGKVFLDINKKLGEDKYVLFSGTPCQIAGLIGYLQKRPKNLLCVDFVCRGVPSPKLWENYIDYMEKKYNSKIVGARFKHKTYGYHASSMKIDFSNGKTYYGSGRIDPFMKAFVREMSSRPSCSACSFKGVERLSDITMFDCYEYSKITGEKDDDKGYSSIFVHTEKGRVIFDNIKDGIEYQSVSIDKLVTRNGVMVYNSAKPHKKRNEFYEIASKQSIDKAMQEIEPITFKDKMIEKTKVFLFKTGLIKFVHRFAKKRKVEIN